MRKLTKINQSGKTISGFLSENPEINLQTEPHIAGHLD